MASNGTIAASAGAVRSIGGISGRAQTWRRVAAEHVVGDSRSIATFNQQTTKVANLARYAGRHPTWIVEYIRGRVLRREDRAFSLAAYAPLVADARTTLCEVLAVSTAEYEMAIQADWWPQHPDDHQAGRASMATIMRAAVRLIRPEVAIETGVARGVTTAVTLKAMEDNSHGHLFSVDLPPLAAPAGYVGELVPEGLGHRWTLRRGPSRFLLPQLLAELDGFDLFLHDADHTYTSQTREFETAWPHLRSGGLLIADDVRNPALIDFAARHRVAPRIIGSATDVDGVGVLRKP